MDETVHLKDLTNKQINKAFERARDEANIQEGELVLITEDMYDAVIDFGIENLAMSEPIACSLGFTSNARPDWEKLWRSILRVGMSIAIVDHHTGDILGIRLTEIGKSDDTMDANYFEHEGFKATLPFFTHCNEKANFYDHFNVEECIHFNGLAVDKRYRNQGIASKLFSVAMKFANSLGVHPLCIKGESSSIFSRPIFEKNGFETLYEQPYSEFIVDNVPLINNTGEHTSMIVYGIQLP